MALRLLLLPLLLLAAALLAAQAQGTGSSAVDCCLKYSKRAVPDKLVKSYRLQGPELGCMLPAVVFTTKRNKKICASPLDPESQKVMESLDKRVQNKKQDKKREQPPRPRGRPRRQKRQQV